MKILIGPDIWQQTADTFLALVRSMRRVKPSKSSKTVPDVTLHVGKTIRVAIARPSKQVTEAEVSSLAKEHGLEVQALTDLLTKRKVRITNSQGVVTNAKPAKPRSGRPKKNARANKDSGADTSSDQLLQPGTNPDLPS